MAKMIDNKPSWKGEGKVWESLSANLPGDNVVYNQREVNGREYDFCVMAENLGLVIIEVKGWDPDKIDVRGVDNIIVDGYDEPQTSPKKQARAYRFAILNKIVEKYNASPLVLDMVCYPFITQEQYVRTKLDIVSEPEYTIFKEDIEDGKKLNEKIQHLFTLNKFIPHTDFSYDLMVRIRKQLEPDFKLSVIDNKNKPYSKLSIFPNGINENLIHAIIDGYFEGVKQIVFVSEQMEFDVFLKCLSDSFKLHNIDLKKNNLKVGYEAGIKVSKYKDAFSTFNISVYCTPNLQKVIGEELVVVDGQCDEKQHELLATLSDMTSFNVQQYDIEHATTNRDILVEAGAGTGKTYSMVSRIAFLCNKQDEPVMNIADEVAMVTFTNDAAINMKKRLKQMFVNYFVLTGYERYLKYVEDIDRANISTIHKFAINILRGESLYTGLGTNFRISSNEYERGKAYDLFLNEYLEKKEEENANFSNELPIPVYDLKKKLMNVADRLFDKSINLETIKSSEMGTVVENNIPYFNDLLQEVMFPAEAIYTEMMRNSNDIDLRDCLIELDKILSNGCNKEDLRIRYLFIDEFQDTDDVQIEVFQKLQKSINADCRLFVVGDLKQSIYRFRGAKLNAFQRLQNGKEVDWCHYRLNRNYRTDGRLLDLFDSVFSGMGAEGILPYKPGEDQLVSDVLTDRNENDLFTELPCHGKDSDNKEIGDALNQKDVLFHVDATQSCGKLVDEIRGIKYNMLSFSAHKLMGPQGVGVLVLKKNRYKLPPVKNIMYGGQQEHGIRPGTIPVALVAGCGKACEIASAEYKENAKKAIDIKKSVLQELDASGVEYSINGDPEYCVDTTINVSLKGVSSEALMISTKQFCGVSNGSACTSKSYSPSYVLVAMGLDNDTIECSLRISWGVGTNKDEAIKGIRGLLDVAKQFSL